jgi:hypothetical protein
MADALVLSRVSDTTMAFRLYRAINSRTLGLHTIRGAP